MFNPWTWAKENKDQFKSSNYYNIPQSQLKPHLRESCSSILMLFHYFTPRQNDWLVTLLCMQFTFGDKRVVYLLGEIALPVTAKERRGEGKTNISPRMKYGHANLISFCQNERCSVFNLSSLSFCTCPSHKFVSAGLFQISLLYLIVCLFVTLQH